MIRLRFFFSLLCINKPTIQKQSMGKHILSVNDNKCAKISFSLTSKMLRLT